MGISDSDSTEPSEKSESSNVESADAEQDESRKLRRLQLMMDLVISVLSQDTSLSIDEAANMVADSRRAALAMFPDKELAYDLIYKPRLQRLMRERFRIL